MSIRRINVEDTADLAADDDRERYGLDWPGKRRARRIALSPSTGALLPSPAESLAWETTRNLMIEGDNLEVLKLLQESHAGRVKLVYIDPPYNRGGDFVYHDNYARGLTGGAEPGGRLHTDWLNMIYPRLLLARSLLREDGWIAVSCDDAELPRARLLVEEVFGEENFIATVIWQKKYTRANDARFFSANHDYVLVACRSAGHAVLGRTPRGEAQDAAYSNPDGHPKGPWKSTPLHARSGSNTEPYTFRNGAVWRPPVGTFRRFNDKAMAVLEADDAIWFGARNGQTPSRKTFLSEVGEGLVPVTLWDHGFAGANHDAANELKALGLGGAFTSPKPTLLIRRLLELTTAPTGEEIVLDFFAGSGTTGQAVMAQNAADGGDRRHILVQLPEPLDPRNKAQKTAADLCAAIGRPPTLAEVTKERLRRAAEALKPSRPGADTGFRAYRLAGSS